MSRESQFRQISYSWWHCAIGIGGLAVLYAAFGLTLSVGPGRYHQAFLLIALNLMELAWPIFFPLWIVASQGALRKPQMDNALRRSLVAVPIVICVAVVGILSHFGLANIVESPFDPGTALSYIASAPNDPRLYPIILMSFTIGPVAEEIFFRGLLYNAFRQWVPPVAALLLQALIFALCHYGSSYTSVSNLTVVFIMGIILGKVYDWRKTLWAPITLHALKNLLPVSAIIVLMALNYHVPAKSWEDAHQAPEWLSAQAPEIVVQSSGEEQRLYAIETWGSKGLRLWKQELRAMQAVGELFPDDRAACAKARLGIATIYRFYLRDIRRAVVECDRIVSDFRDDSETCASALVKRGWAYYELRDYQMSLESFRQVLDSYPQCTEQVEAARKGLERLSKEGFSPL